jgi:hypothetical protein
VHRQWGGLFGVSPYPFRGIRAETAEDLQPAYGRTIHLYGERSIIKLHIQSDSGVTLIENIFIDRYMPGANGEFVKLYLYLLRCAGTGRELSI